LSWNGISGVSWSITSYDVQLSINDGSYNSIYTGSNTSTTYDASINNNTDYLRFKVIANLSYLYSSTSYTYSIESNTQEVNIFKYSTAPVDLEVVSTTGSSTGLTNITVSFKNPSDIGSGDPSIFVVLVNEDETIVQYVGTANHTYNVTISDLSEALSGTVTVYLKTYNTNFDDGNNQGPQTLDGDTSTVPYVSNYLELDDITYEVYTNRNSQNMTLSWNSIVNIDPAWSVVSYEVLLSVNNDNSFNIYVYYNGKPSITKITYGIL
jgi:hypothetical protein